MQNKNIVITKNEAWKLMDAITAYQKNYALTGPTTKLFNGIMKKLKEIVSS